MKVQRSNYYYYYYWLEETHLGRVRIHKFICMVSVNVFFTILGRNVNVSHPFCPCLLVAVGWYVKSTLFVVVGRWGSAAW